MELPNVLYSHPHIPLHVWLQKKKEIKPTGQITMVWMLCKQPLPLLLLLNKLSYPFKLHVRWINMAKQTNLNSHRMLYLIRHADN